MTCNQRTSRPRTHPNYIPHFSNLVNELFNTAIGDVIQKSERKHFTNPATNVITFEDRYELDLALPGFNKKDVAIEVDNNLLTISSKQESSKKGEESTVELNYRLREFNYAGFKKTFTLPDSADLKKINASFDLGILKITIPKKEEAIPQPARKITIK